MKFTLLGGVKNKAKKLVNNLKDYLTKERLIALSMLSRVIGMVLVISVFPVGTIKVNAVDSYKEAETKSIETQVQLNVQGNVPDIIKKNKEPEIVVGESNYQKTQREEAERKAQEEATETQRGVLAREIERTQITPTYGSDPGFEVKRALAQKAASAYGIDWKLLEAVWQVESGKRWDTSIASYAGAQGPMQFMPGTWTAYGQDGNSDGVTDINNAEDALYGAANYLAANGAASGDNYNALYAYNHAQWYVDKVLGVANSI